MATKTAPKLPQGWRVEMLGLINAVQFECWDTCKLLWCDGVWTVVNGAHSMPARGVAAASTMGEARRNGADFISKLEAE